MHLDVSARQPSLLRLGFDGVIAEMLMEQPARLAQGMSVMYRVNQRARKARRPQGGSALERTPAQE